MNDLAIDLMVAKFQKNVETNLREHSHLAALIMLVPEHGNVKIVDWTYTNDREKYAIVDGVRLLVAVSAPAVVFFITEVWMASMVVEDPVVSHFRAEEMPNRIEYATIQQQQRDRFVMYRARLYRKGPNESDPFDKIGPWEKLTYLLPHDVAVYPELYRRAKEQEQRVLDEMRKGKT